jgi:hypothetical protein
MKLCFRFRFSFSKPSSGRESIKPWAVHSIESITSNLEARS